MEDPILEYINTLSLTHEYLNLSNADLPVLHHAITLYTSSPNIKREYQPKDLSTNKDSQINGIIYEEFYSNEKNRTIKLGKLNDEMKIRFYIMQVRLEIIMCEFRNATGTISRIKDLFAQLGIDEEIGPLSLIVILRSELLEVKAYVEANYNLNNNEEEEDLEEVQENGRSKSEITQRKTKKVLNKRDKNDSKKSAKSPFDNLAIMKNVVNSYIDKSSEVIINSINRNAALSVTSSGLEAIRNCNDLYLIQKRKASLDKNVAKLASLIKFDETNKLMINPIVVANESIETLLELLKTRPLDNETMIELSSIYLKNGRIKEALYCVGETLLNGCSGAWNVWSLRGEICMMQSSCIMSEMNANKKSAKSWLYAAIASFNYALEICSGYIRAWCGLYVSLQKLSDLKLDTVDLVYTKMKMITLSKLKELKDNTSVSIKEREKIVWILNNY